MGARIKVEQDEIKVESGKLKAANINLKIARDLGRIVAVLVADAEGKTEITVRKVTIQRIDRLASMRAELHSLGARYLLKPTMSHLESTSKIERWQRMRAQ